MFWPTRFCGAKGAWGCLSGGTHLHAPGHRELLMSAPSGLATWKAMQAKHVFLLGELAGYFCLVEITENFRKEKSCFFLKHLFHYGIFVNSTHYKEDKKNHS